MGYTYDHNHNRKTKTLNGATENYTYDNADEILTRAVGVTSRTFAFDVNGNQVGNVNYTTHADGSVGSSETDLAYDDAERLTYWHNSSGNKVNQFAYNGLGMRVYKHDMSGDYNYVCDGVEPGSAILTDGAATYTEGLSERRGGVSSYTHPDALGSLRTLTQGQSLIDTLVYDAFGVSEADTNPQATPLKFVGSKGYQLDADSNFELLGHRYYSTATGRFISQDPIQDGDNWYAYVDNNPLGRVDPSGEAFQLGGGNDLGSIGDQYSFISAMDSFHMTIMAAPTPPSVGPDGNSLGQGPDQWETNAQNPAHPDHYDYTLKQSPNSNDPYMKTGKTEWRAYPNQKGGFDWEQKQSSIDRGNNRIDQYTRTLQKQLEKIRDGGKSKSV